VPTLLHRDRRMPLERLVRTTPVWEVHCQCAGFVRSETIVPCCKIGLRFSLGSLTKINYFAICKIAGICRLKLSIESMKESRFWI